MDSKIRCPHCHRPTTWQGNDNRPFCSDRCRMIDLGAWIEESYRIPDGTRQPAKDTDK
jgi:endogenous inhibitor of DNA gyrase (YacG/DUF329 family)